MSVLQRITGWLSARGSNNAQTAYGGYRPRGYYGSPEAEDAYGSMASNRSFEAPEEPFDRAGGQPSDRFSGSGDPYNGRVPYRSQQEQYYARQEDYRQPVQPDMRHRRADTQQEYPQPYPQQEVPQAGNVVDFPGQQASTPTHVEYVILLRSRNECTKIIEYIKTNASVFLNMEYIANEGERQRCVDMLSGAAYTLGCQLHKISNRGIYLIASPYVRVMIDPAMKRFNSTTEAQPFMQQQTGEYPPAGAQESRPFSAAQGFSSRMSEPAEQADPYAQQQAEYSPFQRPRPSFQTRQAEPFRRASSGQYQERRTANYPSSF